LIGEIREIRGSFYLASFFLPHNKTFVFFMFFMVKIQ